MPTNYETARTKRWRATELQERERRTLDHIEEFGCTVVNGAAEIQQSSWAYSIGIYDTCGQPEIIVIGLKSGTADYLVNEAARQLRNGRNLAEGRHPDLLGEVECEFRPVDPKWVKHLMGWAEWYYDHEPYPVLQAIYPDLQNRFQDEADFTEYFRQPLLQADSPWTQVEKDFWAENDPESSLWDWPFKEGPSTIVYLSKTVQDGTEAILYVAHEHDGDWQFVGTSMRDGGGPVLSCFHHPVNQDATLKELADLPVGWYAERENVESPWVRSEVQDEGPGGA